MRNRGAAQRAFRLREIDARRCRRCSARSAAPAWRWRARNRAMTPAPVPPPPGMRRGAPRARRAARARLASAASRSASCRRPIASRARSRICRPRPATSSAEVSASRVRMIVSDGSASRRRGSRRAARSIASWIDISSVRRGLQAPPRTTDSFRRAAPANTSAGNLPRQELARDACLRAIRQTSSISVAEIRLRLRGRASARARAISRSRRAARSARACIRGGTAAARVACHAMIWPSSVERSVWISFAALRDGSATSVISLPHLRRMPAEENRQQHQRQQRGDDEDNRYDRRPRAVGTDAPDASPFSLPFCHNAPRSTSLLFLPRDPPWTQVPVQQYACLRLPYECAPTIAESSSASGCRVRSSACSTARTR